MDLEHKFDIKYAWTRGSKGLATRHAVVQAWLNNIQVQLPQGCLNSIFHALYTIQVKGWRYGLQKNDYDALCFPDPTWSTPAFFSKAIQTFTPLILKSIPQGTKVYVQWDGDPIADGSGSFGIFVIAIAITLSTLNMFAGFLCTTLTSKANVDTFAQTFIAKCGGHLLFECFPSTIVIFVAYALEDEIRENGGMSVYGSIINKLFVGQKIVFAIGGGQELQEEEMRGYTFTTIYGIPLSRTHRREDGSIFIDTSYFARRYEHRDLKIIEYM